MSARIFVVCLGLRKTEFGEQELIVLWPMLANNVVLSVTSNLLFIPSRSATPKQKSAITYMFVAKLSGLAVLTLLRRAGSCVYCNHCISCPSPGRKPRQAARVGNLLLAGCRAGLLDTHLSVIRSKQNK